MKKAFSLLLVGVVTVSMFSFIRPNHVDAIGGCKTPYIEITTLEPLLFTDKIEEGGFLFFGFFDKKGKQFGGGIRPIKIYMEESKTFQYYLSDNAEKMEIEVLHPKIYKLVNNKKVYRKRPKTTFTAVRHDVRRSKNEEEPFIRIYINPDKIHVIGNPNNCSIYDLTVERT